MDKRSIKEIWKSMNAKEGFWAMFLLSLFVMKAFVSFIILFWKLTKKLAVWMEKKYAKDNSRYNRL